jgi:hypothetical protein
MLCINMPIGKSWMPMGGGKAMCRTTFRDMPDDEIWWPRNTRQRMGAVAARAGWIVILPDLELVKRESIILLKKRAKSHKSYFETLSSSRDI